MLAETVEYTVDVTGSETGKPYAGVFKVKTSLSMRESLKEDELRRSMLGANPADAGDYAASIASVIAYLMIRMVDSPDWWKHSKNGTELKDENVLAAVNKGAVDTIQAERDKLTAKADEAAQALKEHLPKP